MPSWPSAGTCRPGARESRTLLAPMVLARLLQNADIGAQSRVLDGAGATGYAAAIMARMESLS